jgi:hypothetical protein
LFAALLALFSLSLGCSNSAGGGQSLATHPITPSPAMAEGLPAVSLPNGGAGARAQSSDDVPHVQILPTAQSSGNSHVQRIDLGTVRQGECIRRTIIVENLTSEDVAIHRFESSCECLALAGVPVAIHIGANARLDLVLDSRREPDFCGNLAIIITGFGGARRLVEMEVCVVVRDRKNAEPTVREPRDATLGTLISFRLPRPVGAPVLVARCVLSVFPFIFLFFGGLP